MRPTDQTLLEQLRITEFDIESRKELFALTQEDFDALSQARFHIENQLDAMVDEFYEMQATNPEIALLIGDADTLGRLRNAQRRYVIDLFAGVYDMEYVNNRLRIGLVHKRIGVDSKLYLAAIYTLKRLLVELVKKAIHKETDKVLNALDKLILFDISLVFETYIRSLVNAIEIGKNKTEQYARELEEKVRERTQQLEYLSRQDALTGLLNKRYFFETLTRCLRAAERRKEPVSLVFMDINDFKMINDTYGHQKGDELLKEVADIIKNLSRADDVCFRYGGDEFCIIMQNCDKKSAESIYLTRLKEQLKMHELDISISTGAVQTGPNEYLSETDILELADSKMYLAKHIHQETSDKQKENQPSL